MPIKFVGGDNFSIISQINKDHMAVAIALNARTALEAEDEGKILTDYLNGECASNLLEMGDCYLSNSIDIRELFKFRVNKNSAAKYYLYTYVQDRVNGMYTQSKARLMKTRARMNLPRILDEIQVEYIIKDSSLLGEKEIIRPF